MFLYMCTLSGDNSITETHKCATFIQCDLGYPRLVLGPDFHQGAGRRDLATILEDKIKKSNEKEAY